MNLRGRLERESVAATGGCSAISCSGDLVVFCPPGGTRAPTRKIAAFTLLEVIIACAIFFMCAFAILELVTRGLSAARSIQQREPDAGLILAPFSLTNRFEVGVESGDFEELYPGVYPGYSWTREISQPYGDTNPLFQVTVTIVGTTGKRKTSESTVATLKFCPDCLNGGTFGRGSMLGR